MDIGVRADALPADSGSVPEAGPEDTGPPPPPPDGGGPADSGVNPDAMPGDLGPVDAGDPCMVNHGGCDVHATCTSTTGSPECRCLPGYMGDGHTCQNVAAQLNGLRWELPCIAPSTGGNPSVCVTPGVATTSTALSGAAGGSYLITLRFRGVVEERTYSMGTANGFFYIGGSTPARSDPWNIYSLQVSSPAQTYYLNSGTSGMFYVVGIDYMAQIAMDSGATITLVADSVDANREEIRNVSSSTTAQPGPPIVVPGIPPAPQAYNGQFIQMDVTDVFRVR